MEIKIIKDGGCQITFTSQEWNIIIDSDHSLKPMKKDFDVAIKYMKTNTRMFLKDLYDAYGNSVISAKDTKLRELAGRYYVADIKGTLKRIADANIGALQGGNRSRNYTFKFNY